MTSNQTGVRTRWRQAKPTTRLFWRAITYGIASATVAGAVIGFVWDVEEQGYSGNGHMVAGFAFIGLIYGLIAAPIFAFVMKALAKFLYYSPGDFVTGSSALFRLIMGGLTLIGVGVTAPYFAVYIALTDLLSGASTIPLYSSTILLLWAFGVFLSQVLAQQYIVEVAPRKHKKKLA